MSRILSAGDVAENATVSSKRTAGRMDSHLTNIEKRLEETGWEAAESLPIPCLVTKVGDGKVLFANTAVEEAFGYKRQRLVNRDWSCLIPELDDRRALQKSAAKDGRVRGLTVKGRRKNGETIWVSVWRQRLVCYALECQLIVLVDVTQERLEAQQREQRQQTLQQLLELSDHDREMIACDIHDGVIQDMAGALMHLEAARRAVQNGKPEAVEQLQRVMQMLRDGINEARRLIDGVRPPDLDQMGLAGAIQAIIERTATTKKIDIRFHHELRGPRLSEQAETSLYRIAQECLNNVWQHSRSSRASVKLIQTDQAIRLTLRDWGVGFDPDHVSANRFGLAGIRQRTRLMGGTATIRSTPGRGCTVSVTFPVGEAQHSSSAG